MLSVIIRNQNQRDNAFYLSFLLGLLLFISLESFAQSPQEQTQTDQQLSTVKDAINQEKSAIKLVDSKRKKLLEQLKIDELAIAKAIKELKAISQNLSQTKARLVELKTEKSQLEKEKSNQENILAKQLRAAYSTGHHDYLKLILNQENSASVQRTLTYYQYLNSARMKEIEQYQSTINQLTQVVFEQQEQAKKLTLLEQQQIAQKASLDNNMSKRLSTVSQLNQQLQNSQQKLDKLIAEEAELVAALARIAKLSKQEVELNGLSQLKRQLAWPVNGKINHSFGSRKQDYLKWKGVLMAAPLGREVKTIHNGTVLFSDWLKGYGLVTVIDHGEGYMSLYGHNQALLKSVGERVETGEPIALVGQSGGQSQPALYFEIRHNGQAVNPKLWCK